MGRKDDWVLNGMWIDRAMIRNKLAYDLFNELATGSGWAPDSAYAELTLNGEFQGLYLLYETVNHAASRIDFAADDGLEGALGGGARWPTGDGYGARPNRGAAGGDGRGDGPQLGAVGHHHG